MESYYQKNKIKQQIYFKNLYESNIANKKYHCVSCVRSYRDKAQLNKHYKGKKHNGTYKVYKCPYMNCNFVSVAQIHLNKHVGSKKHSHS
jgi:hypothetical protein